ncbi:hypothetical protein VC81_01920 [Levilactobacillus spicheri]|uniref:Uncharacterized protein n=1 Tax=Levilactobacillus spicheri TaxID=216463 RepID=A0A0F3RUU1_9LACO|nr:hypothetical protein VC81_01920 [Levilactobacillus spicheri]
MNKLPYSLNLFLPVMLIADSILGFFNITTSVSDTVNNIILNGTLFLIGLIWLISYAVYVNKKKQ